MTRYERNVVNLRPQWVHFEQPVMRGNWNFAMLLLWNDVSWRNKRKDRTVVKVVVAMRHIIAWMSQTSWIWRLRQWNITESSGIKWSCEGWLKQSERANRRRRRQYTRLPINLKREEMYTNIQKRLESREAAPEASVTAWTYSNHLHAYMQLKENQL